MFPEQHFQLIRRSCAFFHLASYASTSISSNKDAVIAKAAEREKVGERGKEERKKRKGKGKYGSENDFLFICKLFMAFYDGTRITERPQR